MNINYEQNAQDYLKRHNISFSQKFLNNDCPPSCDGKHIHGYHYKITFKRGKERVSFDFYNSYNDAKDGKEPNPYDCLNIVELEANCPDDFSDFCAELGYSEDSRKDFSLFKKCQALSIKLNKFFSQEELQDLVTLNE